MSYINRTRTFKRPISARVYCLAFSVCLCACSTQTAETSIEATTSRQDTAASLIEELQQAFVVQLTSGDPLLATTLEVTFREVTGQTFSKALADQFERMLPLVRKAEHFHGSEDDSLEPLAKAWVLQYLSEASSEKTQGFVTKLLSQAVTRLRASSLFFSSSPLPSTHDQWRREQRTGIVWRPYRLEPVQTPAWNQLGMWLPYLRSRPTETFAHNSPMPLPSYVTPPGTDIQVVHHAPYEPSLLQELRGTPQAQELWANRVQDTPQPPVMISNLIDEFSERMPVSFQSRHERAMWIADLLSLAISQDLTVSYSGFRGNHFVSNQSLFVDHHTGSETLPFIGITHNADGVLGIRTQIRGANSSGQTHTASQAFALGGRSDTFTAFGRVPPMIRNDELAFLFARRHNPDVLDDYEPLNHFRVAARGQQVHYIIDWSDEITTWSGYLQRIESSTETHRPGSPINYVSEPGFMKIHVLVPPAPLRSE